MRGHLRQYVVMLGFVAAFALSWGCRPSAKPSAPSAALSVDKQEYIWVIEHGAFELEQKFGAALRGAMSRRDVEAVQAFFLPELKATILDANRRSTLDHGYLREVSAEGASAKPLPADAASLAAHLCAYFDDFREVKKTKCRVLDLHAQDRNPATGIWTMTLLITGVGKDARGAPIEFTSHHHLQCRYFSDEEIEAGKIVREWTVQSESFRYAQAPLFEEVTAEFGLDQVDIRDNWQIPVENVRQYYSQMAVEDFDRDGFLDIAFASANGRWQLWRNVAGRRFVEATADVGLPRWSYEQPSSRAVEEEAYLATWIDFDNDGYPDLVLGDRLYHNLEGRLFEDVTAWSGLHFQVNPRGCVVADYDGDGLLDLYVLYQHPREHNPNAQAGWVGDDDSGAENHLWRNVGQGRFVNVTDGAKAGAGKRQTFAAAWLHANDDHHPDLYVANDFGTNSLLINQGNGRFRDVAETVGVGDFATSMGVAAGDITGDGAPEIYVANMFSKMGRRIIAHVSADDYPPGVYAQIQGSCAGNSMYTLGAGQPKYREISEPLGVNQVGWAYAPALADFDNDGWLDIYATTGFLSFEPHKPDG